MAEKREKSVEEQIAEADLVNTMKGISGEEGENLAKKFLKCDEDTQVILTTVMGLKITHHLSLEDAKTVCMIFQMFMEKDKDACTLLFHILNTALHDKVTNRMKKKNKK